MSDEPPAQILELASNKSEDDPKPLAAGTGRPQPETMHAGEFRRSGHWWRAVATWITPSGIEKSVRNL